MTKTIRPAIIAVTVALLSLLAFVQWHPFRVSFAVGALWATPSGLNFAVVAC